MSTAQKRGFRLPWSSDHAPQDPAEEAANLATLLDADELGAGPFASSVGDGTREAALGSAEAPGVESEAVVLESVVQGRANEPETGGRDGTAEPVEQSEAGAWPETDRHDAPAHKHDEPPPAPAPARPPSRPGRRENPLVAGLVRAMREAAEASRSQTMEELRAEARGQVEAIKEGATDGAAAVRKQADDDIAEIREWAKAEAARIRQESEQRIADRREAQTQELAAYEAAVEARIAQVEAAVAAYEQEMDQFFAQLLAEDDPARVATLAERAPEPPMLSDLAVQIPAIEAVEPEAPEVAAPEPEALAPADAAAAEAAAFEELGGEDGAAAEPTQAGEPGVARVIVTGLKSVGGISAFKGALGQLHGVQNVSVAAGDPGSFVFTIQHDGETNLRAAIPDLPGFGAQITDDDGVTLSVAAHEPAA
jgi:hypothetical protein